MKKYVRPLTLLFICSMAADLRAVEPVYSLDSMTHHPYRYVPAFGHASRNPGAPRHFVPGYGYSIPGFGASSANLAPNTNYSLYYQFGHRTHGLYNDATHRFWHNSYGGPWYHPGASTNTQDRWPGM